MKKLFLTTVLLAISIPFLMAQIPQAFKYQAVVRDYNGLILADQSINLRISILSGNAFGKEVYSEIHKTVTNSMGLVNLEIGRGEDPSGSLSAINWAEGDFFIRIEMDEKGGNLFKQMGVTQLLSVPYALYSGTAGSIASSGNVSDEGNPSNNWITFGNDNTSPPEDKLGTTDNADLMIVTNDTQRILIKNYGDVFVDRSMFVGENLSVEGNVYLNTGLGDSTINHGTFTVADLKPTLLSGTLTVDQATDLNSTLNVDGITDLNSNLNVNNQSPSLLTGTLTVHKDAFFNQHVTLTNSNLNSSSHSSGALVVKGGVGIEKKLNVGGNTTIEGFTRVTNLTQVVHDSITDSISGAFVVDGGAGVAKDLYVGGALTLDSALIVNGQVNIHYNADSADKSVFDEYALKIDQCRQGIAIKVNDSRSSANNFISFWDTTGGGTMWGRIEGQTYSDMVNYDEDYQRALDYLDEQIDVADVQVIIKGTGLVVAIANQVAAIASSTACFGLGACVTTPIPSLIIGAAVKIIVAGANFYLAIDKKLDLVEDKSDYVEYKFRHLGVSFQSGAADYAEWLLKENSSDVFKPGQLVGLKNGMATKNLKDADKILVVSTNPIVLGNMPPEGEENKYVKSAFMGQVPVNVYGRVSPGDYILPSVFGDGLGKAVNPNDMTIDDYKYIAGVVWSMLEGPDQGFSLVNIAVGINTNDFARLLQQQELHMKAIQENYLQLKSQSDRSDAVLAMLVPGYAEAIGYEGNSITNETSLPDISPEDQGKGNNIDNATGGELIYYEFSQEQFESALEITRENYKLLFNSANNIQTFLVSEMGELYADSNGFILPELDENPFFKKLDSDPKFKADYFEFVKTTLEEAVKSSNSHLTPASDLKILDMKKLGKTESEE